MEEQHKQTQNKHLLYERKLRRNNLIIFGAEYKEADSLVEFILHLFRNHLAIDLVESDINNLYLLKNNQKSVSPIKVEFVSCLKKDLILKNTIKLKGSKIFITQDLCWEDRQERKILLEHLKSAREQKLSSKIISGNRLIIDDIVYTTSDLKSRSLENKSKHQGNDSSALLRDSTSKEISQSQITNSANLESEDNLKKESEKRKREFINTESEFKKAKVQTRAASGKK